MDTDPDGSVIQPRTALLCAIFFTTLYIAPFYLSATLRSSPLNSRDAPSVIRARVRAVGLTCLASTLITVYIFAIHGHATPQDTLRLLGMWPMDPMDIVKVTSLVCVLFAGPLYESIIVDGNWRHWGLEAIGETLVTSWIDYRNLVIAPATEELVFRSLTISLYLLAKVRPTEIVLMTPLIFGLAHVHHLVEFLRTYTPADRSFPAMRVVVQGLIRSTFQFTYTSLFGIFAAFVYLRTGNIWACILAHSFCNWMGVPRMAGRVGQDIIHHPAKVTPDVAQGKRNEDDDEQDSQVRVGNSLMQDEDADALKEKVHDSGRQAQGLSIAWTVTYYVLIFLGSFGFYKLLWPLTESANALALF